MGNAKVSSRFLSPLLLISLAAPIGFARGAIDTVQQATLEQLEAQLQKQYAAIEDLFLKGPAKKVFPPDPRERLRRWQDDLARSFALAGATIEEILKLHPSDEEKWRERRDTMGLYSQPPSPPESRTVFGDALACLTRRQRLTRTRRARQKPKERYAFVWCWLATAR